MSCFQCVWGNKPYENKVDEGRKGKISQVGFKWFRQFDGVKRLEVSVGE